MEIRRYKHGEESAIWSVYFAATHESNAKDYHPDLLERWAPHDQDMGQWAQRLMRTNPFVAIVADQIVGMAEIESDGFIDYFYVHPKCQGKGVGTALLATLESEAARIGVKVIWADVSITAKEFFASRGFSVLEAKANIILGHPAPNFRMQKTLTSEALVASGQWSVVGGRWLAVRGAHPTLSTGREVN
jgi:putative acetyltransferase